MSAADGKRQRNELSREDQAKRRPPNVGTLLSGIDTPVRTAPEAAVRKRVVPAMPAGLAERAADGIHPSVWIDALAGFGWRVDKRDDAVQLEAGEFRAPQIAETTASDGTPYRIHLSPVTYRPGDLDDAAIPFHKAEIESAGQPAILLFERPYVGSRPHRSEGVLFGGLAWDGERWWHFCLRPGNVDDVVRQASFKMERLGGGAFRDYGSMENMRIAAGISAKVNGLGDRDLDDLRIKLGIGPTGWGPIMAMEHEIAEQMTRMGF